MKNLMKLSFIAIMMAGLLFTTGCGKDDEPAIPGPSMEITTTPIANSDGVVEVEVGSDIAVTVVALTPAGFNTIRIANGTTAIGEQTRTDLGLDPTDLTSTANFTITLNGDAEATFTLTVTVVDEAGGTATEDISILLVAPPSPAVKAYTAQLIYAPAGDGSTASWFSTNLGTTVTEAQVNAGADPSSGDIDFGYYATSSEFGLASPSDFSLAGIDISDWTQKNATSFKMTTLSAEDYLALAVGTDLEAAFTDASATATGDQKFTAVGDVIAFKLDDTKDGKTGVIKIVAIVDGDNNGEFFNNVDYVEVEVLVEQ